ncbi:MAG TPA: hypothetical protein VHH11_01975 [Gammaproteobacteria bacterium]|jgi:hypothetical protein|nr:hypothetical protein [Gammaproteobacteria bacterium]
MKTNTRLALSLAAACLLANFASAKPALDDAGKCRDSGKYVRQSLCQMPAQANKCRDVTTKKFAKCDAPNTEPVPSKESKKAK